MNCQTIVLLLATALFVGSSSAAKDAPSGLLDGQAFTGLNGEKGRELDPDEHEEIVFSNGRFVSTTCYQYNFADAPYTARRVGDSIHFEAVTESPTHGQIIWQGVITGDRAQMTFVWTKERWYWDIHREYWFEGRLKQ